MGLLTQASVAIDGSKFKAVNNRDRNFTRAKMERRMAQIEESVARYLQQLDSADRQEPSEGLKTKTSRLKEKIAKLKEQSTHPVSTTGCVDGGFVICKCGGGFTSRVGIAGWLRPKPRFFARHWVRRFIGISRYRVRRISMTWLEPSFGSSALILIMHLAFTAN
jgi:hypothetical protein